MLNTFRKIGAIVAAALVLSALFVACGGEDPTPTPRPGCDANANGGDGSRANANRDDGGRGHADPATHR